MAYNPRYLCLKDNGTSSSTQTWTYRDTVPPATVDNANYLSDGGSRGLRMGDRVEYLQVDNQDDPTAITAASTHVVVSANAATGNCNLSDMTAVVVANAD